MTNQVTTFFVLSQSTAAVNSQLNAGQYTLPMGTYNSVRCVGFCFPTT